MKKILLFIMFTIGTLSYSECDFVKGIEKDNLVQSVYGELKSVGYDTKIYCDNNSDYMLYYWSGRSDLQVGIYYRIESVNNSYLSEIKEFQKKSKKVLNKIAKNNPGKTVTMRLFVVSNSGTLFVQSLKLGENKKITYLVNENLKNTKHFPDYSCFYGNCSSNDYSFTSDIIY